ncbi:MAG TPA: PAS domain S-box protein [Desulfuromonadales bacterium]|nr:PAS domain S-box protein [Desulfuromonadales bacterium]
MLGENISSNAKKAAIKVAAIYAFAAGLWIQFSDRFLLWYFDDPASLTRMQTAKGWVFVLITALLLAWLVRHTTREAYLGRELFDEVISNIPIYVFWKDREGRYLGCNQRFASVAGVGSKENIVGKTDYDLTWRREEVESRRRYDRVVMEKRVPLLDVEETQLQPDGKEAVFLTSRVPLANEWGEVAGVLAICADITQRKRAEKELRESRDRAQAILLASLDAIVEMDEKGIITGWNPQAEEMFGWPVEEAVGKRLSETIIPPPIREAHEKGLKHFLQTGEGPILNRRIEVMARHRDGHEFPVQLAVTPILLRGTHTFTAFIEDISERRKAEEALRESDRMKTEFVTAVAQEFSAPLTSTQEFCQLLMTREDLSSAEQREFVSSICQRSVGLAKIVADILDIAHIEAGHDLSLDLTPCTVKEIFSQAKPFLATWSTRHRLDITLAEEGTLLNVDKAKMGQILENIISNAIKYSPEGRLVRIRGDRVSQGYRISVADEGIGMTEEQAAKVFEKFYRADAPRTAGGGVGLGMSIVKHIVEAFGGEIRVESALGRGTTVSVTLPVAAP